ncbi:VanZ family protein [Heyndrickxia ginsengihumi]|uniref:VanZ family protein n=2 Tax=Heyndrickxia ginsengihumi TaxID=363870 RepID=A0A0A6V7Y7_9BACI|nr:VanZ family protein [Heyndrickxia ginsengihumi]KHD84170.1 hypothetical protein NG54_17240 [Heyndrickxia ginsengihumi]MBE6184197.1 VanZ family protein [Bacillus sp. (in: firmicutes)]MCM3023438.1 VanZ family protein [Heyndrickxia ginsengihumi]NEY20293.1 VanZ family protein [Heyndrickxia ginsengihumi]
MLNLIKNFLLKRKAKTFIWIIFILYFSYMVDILFLASFRQNTNLEEYNLKPFKTILMYIMYYHYFTFQNWFANLFGNILAFMPLGFIIPLLFQRMKNGFKLFLLTFFISFTVELIQLLGHIGGFDVDDITLNTIGGIFGYWMLLFMLSLFSKVRIEFWTFHE